MKITGSMKIEMEVTDQELGHAVMARALAKAGVDDPGVDYITDEDGHVYMAEFDLGSNPEFALLVDAANLLIYGRFLEKEGDQHG
jgi:hypothetical protein